MSRTLRRLAEAFSLKTKSGYAVPQKALVYETPRIPLADVISLYERDPTCKASVDLLAASAVGAGFYTTVNESYEKAGEAKRVVDDFNENVNLDALLCDMARGLIACGNDFWLKLTPENLRELQRLPVDAVERVQQSFIEEKTLKIPYKIESYKLRQAYGGQSLDAEAVVHWRINCCDFSGYGTGVLQVLLHSLVFQSDKRPAFAWMKAKIERIMPRIFEKYAGPDVSALLDRADENTIKLFEQAIKNRGEEGAWLFYSGKGDIRPVTLDPRARFEYYVDHLINQFYLGCETPLPRLFSTPGFTEASAKAAFTLDAGKEADTELYPVLNLWLSRESSFNGNVTLTLFDAANRTAGHAFTVGHEKWFQTQVRVGAADADVWQVESGFDWTQVKKVQVVCWFDGVGTGSFWVDGLFFGGRRYSKVQEDVGSQSSYGLRELAEVDEELWSDGECESHAKALLASLKDPAEQLTLRSTVVDYGTAPLLAGDTVHVALPNEGVNGDFRVLSAEYHVDARTQTLETMLELGREKPLLADYMFRLKSKTDSLSRYKLARA